MAIKVRQGGAWVTVAEKNGVAETYTLPLTGATGAASVGSAKWTLDASTGTDTSVTLNPGDNINISAIDITGNDRSFTLSATDTTYDYLLKDHGSSTGSGTGNDVKLRLSENGANPAVDKDIRLIAGTNISFSSSETNDTLTISASGGSQASPGGPDHAVQFNDNGSFNGNAQFTYDGSQYVTWTGTNSTISWDSTQDAFEFNDGSEASFGTGKDLRIYHSSNNSYIDEWVGNDLYIRGKSSASTWNTSNKIYISAEANRASIIATANASVELYDAGPSGSGTYHNKVLQTNSRGIGLYNTDTGLGGELSIFEATGSAGSGNNNYISIACTTNLNASYTLMLPPDDGDPGEVLKTDGFGNLDWTTNGSGATSPGGPDHAVQFNDNGSFGGTANFTYDGNDVYFVGNSASIWFNQSLNEFVFNDGARASFGTSKDLKIYHSSSSSYIDENVGNDLYIRGKDSGSAWNTNNKIQINAEATRASIIATANSSVELYDATVSSGHGRVLETNSRGIGVHHVNGSSGGQLSLFEGFGTTNNRYVALASPNSLTASYTLTLPPDDGNANEVLKTDGNGNLDWTTNGSGGGDTYTLPLTGATGASGVGSAKWTLDASSGTDTSVTLNPGANINISAISTSGNDRSFTLAATNTTYLLKCTKDSNGGSTGTDSDPYLFLDASGTGTDDSVRIVGTGNVTVTRDDDGQLTINGSGSSGATTFTGLTDTPGSYSGQGGKLVAVKTDLTGTQKLEFIDKTTYAIGGGGINGSSGAFQSGTGTINLYKDGSATAQDTVTITAGANIRIDGTSASGFTITANNSGSGGGTTYDYLLEDGGSGSGSGSGNDAILRLRSSGGDNDDITLVAGKNITLTQNSTDESITFKSGVTVQDEGSSLSTVATTLNFTGAGVVATGTGETKTITISGGSGGSTTYTLPTTQNSSSDPVYLTLTPNSGTPSDSQKVAIRGSSTISVSESPIGNVGGFIISTTAAANTTYDLKGGGTDGSNYTTNRGSGKIILEGSVGNDDEVTITAGQNIKIDGTGATGFTISAASSGSGSGPTYTLPLTGSSGSSGNAQWTLTPSDSSASNTVKLNAGNNVSISSLDTTGPDYEFTIDVTQGGGLTIDANIDQVFSLISGNLSADDAGSDGLVYWDDNISGLNYFDIGTNNAGKVLKVNSTGNAIEWGTVSGGGGTTYDLGTRTGGKIRLTGSSGNPDDITFTGTAGISVTSGGDSQSNGTITISGSSVTGTTYDLSALLSPGIKLTGSNGTTDSIFFDSDSSISITRTVAPGTSGGGTIKFSASSTSGGATYGLSAQNGINQYSEKIRLTGTNLPSPGYDEVILAVDSNSSLTIGRSGNTITFGGGGSSGGNTTYTLPLTGSSSAVAWTLTGTNPTSSDPVTMNAGSGIEFSSIATGAFTISASSTSGGATYALDGIASSSNGSSGIKLTGTNLSGPDNVLIEGADGISVTGTSSKLTISGSAVGGRTYALSATGNSPSTINLTPSVGNSTSINLAVDSTSSLTMSRSGSTITFGGGGSATDTKYDLDAVSSTDGAKIRLVGTTASGNNPDEVELVGGTNVDVTRDSATKITIDFDSANFAIDKITEGNSKVEVVDTSSDSYVTVEIDGEEAARIDSSKQLLLKKTGTHEGGHIAFYDASTTSPVGGSRSYGIDVYRNNSSSPYVLRFIDESVSVPGIERFSVGPQGQWGVGHVGNRDFGQTGEVFTSNGPSAAPSWEPAGSSSAAYFRVATNVPNADITIGGGSNNVYTAAMTAPISKDAGTDMLIQTQMNFKAAVYNGVSYSAGGVYVYFKIMRRLGTSGTWTQVGEELAITDLMPATSISTPGSSVIYLYGSGGLSVPDASINSHSYPGTNPIYYAVYAKFVGYGRFYNQSGTWAGATLLKGSSIIVTEYGRR